MHKNHRPKMDAPSVMAPLLAMLGIGNLWSLSRNASHMPSGAVEVATVARNLLMVAFLLVVTFYVVRT